MKTKPKKLLTIVIILLSCLLIAWGTLAMLLPANLVSRFLLWGNLVFGCGSIITAISALYISFLSLKRTEKSRYSEVQNEAKNFIIDHYNEIYYVPLCIIASSYNRHHSYKRNIYNAFNKLRDEVQKEVLKQLNYSFGLIDNSKWIDSGIDLVREYIHQNDLGADVLYDNAKYYRHSIEYSSSSYSDKDEFKHIFPDNFNWFSEATSLKEKRAHKYISFSDYLDSYLTKKKTNDPLYLIHKDEKPVDMLIHIASLKRCPEIKDCYWTMCLVDSISAMIIKDKHLENAEYISRGDASIDTYEDRYLESLMKLYDLYSVVSLKN